MNLFFPLVFFLFSFTAQSKIIIAVLDTGPGSSHEDQVLSIFKKELKNCPQVQLKAFPIYDLNGNLKESQFLNSLKSAEKSSDILHFSWNILSEEKTKNIESALKITAYNKIIIAAAGAPEHGSPSQKVSLTVMGKVPNVFLIGEKTAQGHQSIHSFYGPEIFMTLPPLENKYGSSFSSPRFTAAIACHLSKIRKINSKDFALFKKYLIAQKQKHPEIEFNLQDLHLESFTK